MKCVWLSALVTCSAACTGNVSVDPGTDVLSSGEGYVPRDAITDPQQLSDEACETNPPAPGRTTMRRLNRAEYNNALRDLLGETNFPADAFPADDYGYGFDNIGDVLAIGTLYIEKHEQAVEVSVSETLVDSDRRARVLSCEPSAPNCIEQSIESFARRAWRRPVSSDEFTQLVEIQKLATTEGLSRLEAMGLSMQGVLLSPNFVYLVEENLGVRDLSDHELATRLSFFLWSTVPDLELDALADAGTLTDDGVLLSQVERMLADPKASSFFENFTGQWLELRALTEASKDGALFPEFDASMQESMTQQGVAFMEHLFESGANVQELLLSEEVMLDQRLASLHGMNPESYTDTPVPVQMEHARMGVLTLDGVLTSMSHPNETSPVKRGKWAISHHEGNISNIRKIETINKFQIESFARLLTRLKAETDIDGRSILHNSLVLFGSSMDGTGSNNPEQPSLQARGGVHTNYNLPLLLAGSGGGYASPGQHMVYRNEEPLADLYISMLRSVGKDVSSFGEEGTTPLTI